MTDEIISPSLSGFLDRLGLPPAARDRVIEIDRQLSEKIDSDAVNSDRCALLIFEAADLIADRDPPGFDWTGWGDDNPGDANSFDSDGVEWGEE